MLELLAIIAADPLSWPLWLVVTFAAGMYPVGFLFGTCSACCTQCSTETCDGFDLTAAYDGQAASICSDTGWDLGYGPYGADAGTGCRSYPEGLPPGCNASSHSPVMEGGWGRRKSCVRFLCRCYESDGNGGYTVVSNTVVGGPTTNDLDLSSELDDATVGESSIESHVFENDGFYNDVLLSQPEGSRFCMVWMFVFYGWTSDCETTQTGVPTPHESRDDCYQIFACPKCVP